jgi:hypothetical protein
MQRLSKSESRLLIFFCVAIFVAANMFGLRYWMKKRGALRAEMNELQTRIEEDRSWVDSATNFKDAAAWVEQHRPPAMAADSASVSLVDIVRRAAEAQQLTVTAETLLPASNEGDFSAANLQIKLVGGFPGVVRLLFELQQPEAWRAIDKLTLRSDSTPPNTVLEFKVRQYHTLPSVPAVSANP